MDPNVVNDPRYRDTIEDDLRAMPSLSIVMNLKDLFDPASGIYANAINDGIAWERPTSLELIYPDGRDGFQEPAGLRIRGGFSRAANDPVELSFLQNCGCCTQSKSFYSECRG